MNKCLLKIMLTTCCAAFIALSGTAQNKNIDKGKDLVVKAMEQADQQKRNELLQKADEQFREGGMKREQYVIIGDAFLEKKDFINAYNYYNRCDKPEKKEGMRRLGEVQLDVAMEANEKEQPKLISKALNYYTKGDAMKEGAVAIGDKFYEKGFDFYAKALEYYLLGEASGKVDRIAGEYLEKGGDFEPKAAEAYMKLKTPEGFERAGDIYFRRKEYLKAQEAYNAGNVTSGLRKYADYLYSQNQNEEADKLYVQLAEVYGKKGEADEVEKLANNAMSKGSYALASQMYEKAENMGMSNRCFGIEKLVRFSLDSAVALLGIGGDPGLAKAISDNMKPLKAMGDAVETLDGIKHNQPFVSQVFDTLTGKMVLSAEDQRSVEDYYKSVKSPIADNVYIISKNYNLITSADVKKYIQVRLVKDFPAVSKLLDPATFAVRVPKDQVKGKDVILMRW